MEKEFTQCLSAYRQAVAEHAMIRGAETDNNSADIRPLINRHESKVVALEIRLTQIVKELAHGAA